MGAAEKVLRMDDYRDSGPQLEDGHIRIANELFDAIIGKLKSFRHVKVALAIVRKTYGYQKKEDDITVSQLSEMTEIHRNHVGAALRELEALGVLNTVRAGRHGLILGINKHHSQWAIKDRSEKVANPPQDRNQNSCSEQPIQLFEATKTVVFGNQKVAHKRQPQKTTPKDNPKRIAQSADCATSANASEAFAGFWQTFGYKRGKADAEKAFRREYAKSGASANWLEVVMLGAAKEALRRPHLVANGQTPIYAQGWLSGRRYEDEDLLAWGEFSVEQQEFIDTFNANIGDECLLVAEWTERRAALVDVARSGAWGSARWAEFWRYVRDRCEFRWPVSMEWMLTRENFAKIKGGQYERGDA